MTSGIGAGPSSRLSSGRTSRDWTAPRWRARASHTRDVYAESNMARPIISAGRPGNCLTNTTRNHNNDVNERTREKNEGNRFRHPSRRASTIPSRDQIVPFHGSRPHDVTVVSPFSPESGDFRAPELHSKMNSTPLSVGGFRAVCIPRGEQAPPAWPIPARCARYNRLCAGRPRPRVPRRIPRRSHPRRAASRAGPTP